MKRLLCCVFAVFLLAQLVFPSRSLPSLRIVDFDYPSEKLLPGLTEGFKVTVKNEGDTGTVGVGLHVGNAPLVVTGGGFRQMEHNQTETIELNVTSTGGLEKDTAFILRLQVGNHAEFTETKNFAVIVRGNVGIPHTQVVVETLQIQDRTPIAGLPVTIIDNETEGERVSEVASTEQDGIAHFDLEYFEGIVQISVTDSSGKWEPFVETRYVHGGDQTISLVLTETGEGSFYLSPVGYALIVIATACIAILAPTIFHTLRSRKEKANHNTL